MPAAFSNEALRQNPYLSDLAERFPDSDTLERLQSRIATADAEDLPQIKGQFSLEFARTHFQDFDDMGRMWTAFADATIDRALLLAWQIVGKRHKLMLPETSVPGLFILGLGKLGGFDLNFSSDIDLIAFYDAETLPVPAHKGQAYIASEVCKRLTQILQPRNAPDFVWRVDWRLRPESSGTGLAISSAKAETFYFFRSLPWHRLALMKARVVAGDVDAGQGLLNRLEPFIWRRNLDFTTLDELAALKTRINNEHPGLETERAAPDPITDAAVGFNLKLGRGGIREIEFIANAQQLIHGGKRPDLRVTNTRAALLNLAQTELITQQDADELREHYAYFRKVENAVQMFRNEQTHIVPDGDANVAMRALIGNPENFDKEISTRRQEVHARFSTLFRDNTQAEKTTNLSTLDEHATLIARSWTRGFQDHGVPATSRHKYQELGHNLVARVQRLDRPDAFERIDSFLKQLGRSEQYFALLSRHPDLLDKLVSPLLHSPHMSEILAQSPHIIDIFLSPEDSELQEQSEFVLTSPDYEHRLEALRRFVNEQLFLNYTHFLDGKTTAIELQHKLTDIAEETLTLSLRIVADDLGVESIPMTVLGLGKMGTRAMGPKSDLDLIFLFADDCDPDLAAKAVRRMRTTLTTKLREGIAYELDTRLRPSGRSGPPAVKLSAFRDHHMNRAHSWEHIALAPARIVGGDVDLGSKVMAIKTEILTRHRDSAAFKADAYVMFERLAEERLKETPPDMWRTKLRRGGLMEADYIHACFDVLAIKPPSELAPIIENWNESIIWERLLGLTGKRVSETPSRFAQQISIATLPQLWEEQDMMVKEITAEFFADQKTTKPPTSGPVIWQQP
jgi:glutamate-ammonia-ligase adenylyltransferase